MATVGGFTAWVIPGLLALIPIYGYLRGVNVYAAFVAGAAEGLQVAWRILPYVISMMVALAVFRAGGGMQWLAAVLMPVLAPGGVPAEVLPLMLVRPLSGSGALGVTVDLLQQHGPDSFIGRLASLLQGSTDTTFYVLTVYFGAVGVRRVRYAPVVGLTGDVVGYVVAVSLAYYLWG